MRPNSKWRGSNVSRESQKMINRREWDGTATRGDQGESEVFSTHVIERYSRDALQTSPPATWNSSHLQRRNQSTESTGTPIASTHHLMTIGKSCAEWKSPTRTFWLLPPQKWRMALSILGFCADPSARRAQPQPSVDRDGYLATSYVGRYGNGGPRPSLLPSVHTERTIEAPFLADRGLKGGGDRVTRSR